MNLASELSRIARRVVRTLSAALLALALAMSFTSQSFQPLADESAVADIEYCDLDCEHPEPVDTLDPPAADFYALLRALRAEPFYSLVSKRAQSEEHFPAGIHRTTPQRPPAA